MQAIRNVIAAAIGGTIGGTVDSNISQIIPDLAPIKSLKSYSAVSEICQLLRRAPISVIGGATGSGKTIGLASIILIQLAHEQRDNICYFAIPLRKGVSGAFTYMQQLFPGIVDKHLGWAHSGHINYRNHQHLRIATTQHVFNQLAQRLSKDPESLNGLLVVIDEAHCPTVENYLLFSLCSYIRKRGYTMNIVVMSATLESAPLKGEFAQKDVPKLTLEGRPFANQIIYSEKTAKSPEGACKMAAETIETIVLSQQKNVLCFVPNETCLNNVLAKVEKLANVDAVGMISSMPEEELALAFTAPANGYQKVVIATNMAESSITFPYQMDVVVDTGYQVVMTKYGRSKSFKIGRISQANAKQRAGRVGRTAPGTCYRLWTRSYHDTLDPNTASEFEHIDPEMQALALMTKGLNSQEILELSDERFAKMIHRFTVLKLLEKADSENTMVLTDLAVQVSFFQTSLDVALVMCSLVNNSSLSDSERIVGLLIMSFIEGCGGMLPYWLSREERAQANSKEKKFGHFRGHDDLETYFNILTDPDSGLLMTDGITLCKTWGKFLFKCKEWSVAHSMNNKAVRSSLFILLQVFSKHLSHQDPDRNVSRNPEQLIKQLGYLTSQISKDVGGSDILDATREAIQDALSHYILKYDPHTHGYVDHHGRMHQVDKKRSHCMNRKYPAVISLNTTTFGGWKNYISCICQCPHIPEESDSDCSDSDCSDTDSYGDIDPFDEEHIVDPRPYRLYDLTDDSESEYDSECSEDFW